MYSRALSPLLSKDDVVRLIDHVGVGAQEKQVVAFLDGCEASAGHGNGTRTLEALNRSSHRRLKLKDLVVSRRGSQNPQRTSERSLLIWTGAPSHEDKT